MDDINGWYRERQHQQYTKARGGLSLARRTRPRGMPVSMGMYGLWECWCGQTKRAMRAVTPHLFSIAVPSS